MADTETLLMWDIIIGFVSANFVLPLIQQPKWSTKVRTAVTFVYSVAVGLALVRIQGGWDLLHSVIGVGGLLVTSISIYKGFAKDMGIAPAIERWSSPPPPGSHRLPS